MSRRLHSNRASVHAVACCTLLGMLFGVVAVAGAEPESYVSEWVHRTDVGSPGQRYSHAMAFDEHRGVTVFFGGELSNPGDDPTFYGDTWEYDGATWRPVLIEGPAPQARSGHAMTYDAVRQEVVLFGGVNDDGYLREFWAYEPQPGGTARWRALPMFVEGSAPGPWVDGSDNEARAGHAMAFDTKNGVVLVAGGTSGPNSNLEAPGTWRSSNIWIWNGTNWSARKTIAQSIAGSWVGPTRHAMAYDPEHERVVICGGSYYYDGTFDNPSDWQDITDNRFLSASSLSLIEPSISSLRFRYEFSLAPFPGGRQQHAMVYDPRRKCFVVYGGASDTGAPIGEDHFESRSLVLSDGAVHYAMEVFQLVPRPPSRARHAMVYDSRRGVTVLVGGVGGARYDDTWELVSRVADEVWVDFAHTGPELGQIAFPFNTLAEGVNALPLGGRLLLKPGSNNPAPIVISKPVALIAPFGPVRIGP